MTAQLEGFYYRPRVDKAFLAEHTEGVIALSSCNSGELARHIAASDRDKAVQAALWYRDAFGPEGFYVEIQNHEGIPETEALNRGLVSLARELTSAWWRPMMPTMSMPMMPRRKTSCSAFRPARYALTRIVCG